MSSLFLPIFADHVCHACGAHFTCDEPEECAVPMDACYCGKCNKWGVATYRNGKLTFGAVVHHHDDTFNLCKRDPVYAAKIERIMARQRGQDPICTSWAQPEVNA